MDVNVNYKMSKYVSDVNFILISTFYSVEYKINSLLC